MKNLRNTGLILLSLIVIQSCDTISSKSSKLENDKDSASYMIGVSVGYSLKSQQADNLDPNLIAKGIEKAFSGDTAMDMQEVSMYLQDYFSKAQKSEGEAFLMENKGKEGVLETASGLQYKIIKEGTGNSPVVTDKVKCHYTGTLINGDKFDSSVDRGQPAEFMLQGVIPGWTEGLQLMKEGAKYEFYIPSDLAYGARGQRGIPPHSTLIFEVELLEILPAEE